MNTEAKRLDNGTMMQFPRAWLCVASKQPPEDLNAIPSITRPRAANFHKMNISINESSQSEVCVHDHSRSHDQ